MKPFPRHERRRVHCLDDLWDFRYLGNVDLEVIDLADISYDDHMAVPAAFDAMPAYAGKRGTAVYRKIVKVPAGSRSKLHFEAVSMWCRVFIDGEPLRDHACGYTGFWCDVPASEEADRELVVVVDNRFDFERVPLHEEFFDFYQWGGIIRSVWLHDVPECFIEAITVVVNDYIAGAITARIKLAGSVPAFVDLTSKLDGQPVQNHSVQPDGKWITLELRVADPTPWSPQTPNLHTLTVTCQQDDMEVRFGLREVKTQGRDILLNGQKLKLLGYNRHESHPQFGPALPYAQLLADLQLLRDQGCTFIRGSHYPQDQRFLDLCDALGFLVWEENLGWGQREKQLTDERFKAAHLAALEEMVAASINHPSVIMWGFLNEAGTDEAYARTIMEQTVTRLRELDPSRLITYATMFPKSDLFYGLVDVISLNLYPGWYESEGVENPLTLITPYLRSCLDYLSEGAYKDKPVLISEIGAEALYGWHDPLDSFFTEDYQANYLRIVCEEVLNNERLAGVALWHFSDARTYSGGYALKRPRAFNNKGTLDEYRRPKLAYGVVREVFTRKLVLEEADERP